MSTHSSTKATARQTVWYCTKFDEVWLIERFNWNRHMRATFIADDWWETITWPRPNRKTFPFKFVGYL